MPLFYTLGHNALPHINIGNATHVHTIYQSTLQPLFQPPPLTVPVRGRTFLRSMRNITYREMYTQTCFGHKVSHVFSTGYN